MLSVENRYYKLNWTLLRVLGLWPYQNSKRARVKMIIMTIIHLSAVFVQLAVFITHECTWTVMLHVLSIAVPSILSLVFYDVYYVKSNMMKEIMEHMYYDWMSCKHKAEISIMDNYGRIAKLLTEVFTYSVFFGVFAAVLIQTIPVILDITSPLNESRLHLIFTVEYFIDPIKYRYLLLCHFFIFAFLALTSTVTIGMTLLSYCVHTCAMFKIANYRMGITMDKCVLQTNSPDMQHVIYERVAYAVDVHRRAIEYVKLLLSSLGKPFLFLIVIGVVSMSVNYFRFLKAITELTEVLDMLTSAALIFIHICFIFFGNYLGQQITNCNAEIPITVYNLPWYIAPVNIQKSLLFILQKSNKDIYLSAGGMFDASYEGLTTLLTSSISYFTIIYTIQ